MQIFQQQRERHKTKYPKSYFYSDVNRLELINSPANNIDVDPFDSTSAPLSMDLALSITGIDPNISDFDAINQAIDQQQQSIFTQIKTNKLDPDPTVKFGDIHYYLPLTSQRVEEMRQSLKIYFSAKLNNEQRENLLRSKCRINSANQYDAHKLGHNYTFIAESDIYLNSKNQFYLQRSDTLTGFPVKVLGFCYPDFRVNARLNFWETTQNTNSTLIQQIVTDPDDSSKSTVLYLNEVKLANQINECLRINLLAVIEEAKKTNSRMPFIINIPNAFLSDLNDHIKYLIKKAIAQEFNNLRINYSQLISQNISDFIILGGNSWDNECNLLSSPPITNIFNSSETLQDIPVHVVNSDMLDMAKKLYETKGIKLPLPMMLNPSHPIGCQFLQPNFNSRAFDEMLARSDGGINRAIFEGAVLNEDGQDIKDLDRIKHQTLYSSKARKFTVEGKNFYVDLGSIGNEPKKEKYDEITDGIKQNFYQHSFTCQSSPTKLDTLKIIDTAPIFTCAIKEAVQGLDCFENFESDISHGGNLFYILTFANLHQGVGNKITELKQFLIKEKGITTESPNLQELIDQAKILSARFQAKMSDQGIMTGRYKPANIVGARLHRMATKENILQIMQGTKCNERSVMDIDLKFEALKCNFQESARQAGAGAEGGYADVQESQAPSSSPAKVPAASQDGSRTGGGLGERAFSVLRSMRRVLSRSTGGGTPGQPLP
jgi:hypothetical protein